MATDSQALVTRAADRYVRRFERMILQTFSVGRSVVHNVALQAALVSGNREGVERALLPVLPSMARYLGPEAETLYRRLLVVGGNTAAVGLGSLRTAKRMEAFFTFDASWPAAREWAKQHAAELVTNVTEETQAAIRHTVARAFREDISFPHQVRLIEDSIGLTDRDAEAVMNFRQRLQESPGKLVYGGKVRVRVPKDGLAASRLSLLTSRYAQRLLRIRANAIAITETHRAANHGQLQAWRQAIQDGILTGREVEEWIAFDPCPICAGLNGHRVRIGSPFPGGYRPPAHPRCKCTTGLVNARPTTLSAAAQHQVPSGVIPSEAPPPVVTAPTSEPPVQQIYLTPDEIREIRRLRAQGATTNKLARRFHVEPARIRTILHSYVH